MNRALRSILLCILYIFFCAAPAMAAGTVTEQDAPVAEDLWLNAYSAILLDMDTGEVLYESNADEQNYPASTTKMMTALLTPFVVNALYKYEEKKGLINYDLPLASEEDDEVEAAVA